jgi:Modifier of rudimentary (Mod(r)) protein
MCSPFTFYRFVNLTQNPDDSTYDTVFQTVDQWTLIVRVHLPPPSSAASVYVRPPALTLAGIKARHPWLDSRMQVVGYVPIQSDAHWKENKVLLGTAVLQVIQHLQLHPPEVLEIVDKGLQSIQRRTSPTPVSANSNRPSSRTTSPVRPSTSAPPPPSYESAFVDSTPTKGGGATSALPSLSSLYVPPVPPASSADRSAETLDAPVVQNLLEDEIAFLQHCNSFEYTQILVTMVESALERNQAQAQSNLDQQEPLEKLHREVRDLEQELRVRVVEFEGLKAQQDKICQPPPVKEVQRMLNRVKRAAFDESEQMAEEWDGPSSGGSSATEFFRGFVESRKVHHLRAAKLELLLLQDPAAAAGQASR